MPECQLYERTTEMSTAVAVRESATALERIDDLLVWVLDAPIDEICWRLTEIGELRDWARVQQEATELRIRAVRLELVALRRVAQGGLDKKIAGVAQFRSAARWLATLTDEEFATVLDEIDGQKTPIMLYRDDRAARQAMEEALASHGDSEWEDSPRGAYATYRADKDDQHYRRAVTLVLDEVLKHGEPFTVAEAADRLADRLGLESRIREETSEGLRELVRAAIRGGDRSARVDAWASLPIAFTVQDGDGIYTRVPATSATLGHLLAHEREIRGRAEAALMRADELSEMLNRLVGEATEGRVFGVDQLEEDEEVMALVMQMKIGPLLEPQLRGEINAAGGQARRNAGGES